MEYCSIKQTAARWGVSIRWIQVLCKDNRIPGAFRVGNAWAIPADAEKPKDERVKTGKYIDYRKRTNKNNTLTEEANYG